MLNDLKEKGGYLIESCYTIKGIKNEGLSESPSFKTDFKMVTGISGINLNRLKRNILLMSDKPRAPLSKASVNLDNYKGNNFPELMNGKQNC